MSQQNRSRGSDFRPRTGMIAPSRRTARVAPGEILQARGVRESEGRKRAAGPAPTVSTPARKATHPIEEACDLLRVSERECL